MKERGAQFMAGLGPEASFKARVVTLLVTPSTLSLPSGSSPLAVVAKDQYGKTVPEDNFVPTYTWTSSDPSKATVNSTTGVVTKVAAGPTNVKASYNGIDSNNCVVTVS